MHSGAHSVPGRMPAVLDQSPIALHLLPAKLLPPYAIGGTVMFWLIERFAAFATANNQERRATSESKNHVTVLRRRAKSEAHLTE
jgi:hypothetical protein